MRSFGLSTTNWEATFCSAFIRFGLRSRANILLDTSTAITMSIPRVVFVLLLTSTVLGRAIATINEARAKIRKANRNGCNFDKNEVDILKPCRELIFNVADCLLRFQKCHPIAAG